MMRAGLGTTLPAVVPDNPNVRLRRKELAAALTAAGYPIAASTLATLACRPGKTGSPPFRLFGRVPLYEWGSALTWAEGRMSASRRGTSEADAAA